MGMKKQRNNSLTKELREEESRSSNKSHSNSSNRFTLSIPGISHAEERGRVSPTRKAIWLLLFVVGLGLTAQQVHKVMTEYWAYPTKTKVERVMPC